MVFIANWMIISPTDLPPFFGEPGETTIELIRSFWFQINTRPESTLARKFSVFLFFSERIIIFLCFLPSLKLTAKAPETRCLEDVLSFWVSAYFQVRTVSFKVFLKSTIRGTLMS